MDNGYIVGEPIYNSTSFKYDVPILIDDEKNIRKIISCYRILNTTSLVYTEDVGYFYISMDDKYIFFKDTDIFQDILKNIIFSINNPMKTNKEILEINNDPLEKYTYIGLLTVPETTCINLALEDNSVDRLNQITRAGKYNSYDCIVKNMSNNSFTNIENKKESFYDRVTGAFLSPSPATDSDDIDININIVDIHAYNKFYVYGLTSLNLLLIIIIIIMLLLITNEPVKNKSK